jgi:hypothetical protein
MKSLPARETVSKSELGTPLVLVRVISWIAFLEAFQAIIHEITRINTNKKLVAIRALKESRNDINLD